MLYFLTVLVLKTSSNFPWCVFSQADFPLIDPFLYGVLPDNFKV